MEVILSFLNEMKTIENERSILIYISIVSFGFVIALEYLIIAIK